MYRTADERPLCACCRSPELTDITKFDPSKGFSVIHFALRDRPAGAQNDEGYAITRARVCLACGHVMLSLDAKRLSLLRDRVGVLSPIPE